MYQKLFESVQINGVTVPNRLARSPHTAGMPWTDVSDDYIAYNEERAKGGVGLTILGAAGVHPSSMTPGIPLHDDAVIPGYVRMMERLRPYGMKVFQQLQHSGAAYLQRGGVPVSASPIPNPRPGATPPRALTTDEIGEIIEAFAQAARRCQEGGIDGVEIHAAHGYLITQFLSPTLNRRDDQYGGTFENRLRFPREILRAIRREVGPDYPVGMRLHNAEDFENGLGPAGMAEIARELEPDIDFVDMSAGTYWKFYKFFLMMDAPLGYEVPEAEVTTRALSVPTIVTGRIMSLDDAAQIVESGAADMVSMVRPLIADPHLITKAKDGRSAEIRPCIGTNQGCVGKFFMTGRLGCTVNPSAGKETVVPVDVERSAVAKRIVVIGGGAAGLEAARTSALRGHEVVLLEMARSLGGQVTLAGRAAHRADMNALTAWYESELQRLGVTVRLGVPADPDLIASLEPEEVIVATGSTPRDDGFQTAEPGSPAVGASLPHVVSSWDVLSGRATVGETVLIHDDTGGYEAISVAETLAASGVKVTFVHRLETVGANVDYGPVTVYPARERLVEAGVEFIPFGHIVEITPDDVEIALSRGPVRRRIPADTVILVGYNTPNDEIADWLREEGMSVHTIGDARGTRTLGDAIESADALARAL